MFYNENVPLFSAKPVLVEGRYKTTEEQKEWLKNMERDLRKTRGYEKMRDAIHFEEMKQRYNKMYPDKPLKF